jgi:limonene 1,2-monooxygenase
MPYQRPRMEMVQACAITPTGPVAAGRLGLGMLSLAASSKVGFNALSQHWEVYEAEAKKYGKTVNRDSWRVVVSMHIAETKEQAYKDYEWGMLDLIRYSRRISGSYSDKLAIAQVKTAKEGVDLITTEGMGIFGVAMLGTPDDAIAHIEKLQQQSGGFGTFLFLQNNCPSFDAIKKSYELFARYVIPHFHGSNANREASIDWANEHHKETYGGIGRASKAAIEGHGAIDIVKAKAGE